MSGVMKYSNDQIECLKKYYPDSNYDEILRMFPGKIKKEIGEIARYHGIKSNNPGHMTDLTGRKYGRLVVKNMDHKEKGVVFWLCECDCGKKTVVRSYLLTSGKTKSCGCLARESWGKSSSTDHVGERFGLLVAVERYPRYKGGRTYYLCECDCGNTKIVSGSSLVSKKCMSCGCIRSDRIRNWEMKYPDLPYDSRRYIIYKHTSPSSKVYIGLTKQDPNRRWQNGIGYETQPYFWNAIKKYGWESFSHEILESGLSMAEALEKEKEYISEYKSNNPEYGYNTLEGGGGGRIIVNPVVQYYKGTKVNFFESLAHAAEEMDVSEGTIRNYINSNNLPEEYKFEMLSSMNKFDIDPSNYKLRDPYHYRIVTLMRERRRTTTVQRNSESKKKINQYSLEGKYIRTWSSIIEARDSIPNTGSLSASLRKPDISKTAGGFQWRYDDGDHSDIPPAELKNRRPVLQIDRDTEETLAVFPSAAEAERITGVGKKQICKNCRGISKSAGGYIWKYADSEGK